MYAATAPSSCIPILTPHVSQSHEPHSIRMSTNEACADGLERELARHEWQAILSSGNGGGGGVVVHDRRSSVLKPSLSMHSTLVSFQMSSNTPGYQLALAGPPLPDKINLTMGENYCRPRSIQRATPASLTSIEISSRHDDCRDFLRGCDF